VRARSRSPAQRKLCVLGRKRWAPAQTLEGSAAPAGDDPGAESARAHPSAHDVCAGCGSRRPARAPTSVDP
jgi:hypothetical protein